MITQFFSGRKRQVCRFFPMLFLGLSAKPSAQSFSSLSSEASKTSKMGSSSTPTPPTQDAGLYEKLLWSHQHDPKSKEDLVLNRRVGFYRFKSDIGAGNFSKVKLAQHQLTKGMCTVVKNLPKSRIQHGERSELRLRF